ncbi:MAG TPA: type II secretion system F family protein [Egibacteraceae bacterium]|nr:type II secretion system F family protein [Egibacteraceae bacterium]
MTAAAADPATRTRPRGRRGAASAGREEGGVVDAVALAEVRAALAAGASPAAALTAALSRGERGAAGGLPARLRAGHSLADLAERVETGDPAADLLVRALGVAERTGTGGAAAVEQALAAARDEADLARLLRSRTVQARGTAVVLSAVPVLAWVALVAADGAALAFYATPLGALTGGLALTLAGLGQWCSRRLVAAAGRAGAVADPLTPRPVPRDANRMAVLGLPAFVIAGVAWGLTTGLVVAAVAVAVGARRPQSGTGASGGGGAAETVELVAVALTAGLPAPAAVSAVVPLAPPAARGPLGDAARRLRSGWDPEAAFADTGLGALGATLGVTERWGAPAAPALRRLAEDLRADRRAAVEEAAERTQLTLIFPTTLLTLPAFVLGVVPPLLWTAFAG